MKIRHTIVAVLSLCLPSFTLWAQSDKLEPDEQPFHQPDDLRSAQEEVVLRERNYQRFQALYKANAVSSRDLIGAERELAKARLAVARLENDPDLASQQLKIIVHCFEQELDAVRAALAAGAASEEQVQRANAALLTARSQLSNSQPAAPSHNTVLLAFRGVIPGITSEEQLLTNKQWGEPLSREGSASDSKVFEYHIGKWSKVVAVLRDGIVQAVDAVPPKNTTPQKLAEVLKLGRLTPIETLPTGAQLSLPVDNTWKAVSSSIGPGIMFFEPFADGDQVRLLRLYSPSGSVTLPGSAPTNLNSLP